MTHEPSDEPLERTDQLREEAATWFARMRGEQADTHRAAFEAWIARGAVHRAAYNRVAEIFSQGKLLKGVPRATPSRRGRKVMAACVALLVASTSVGIVITTGTRKPPASGFVERADRGQTSDQLATRVGEIRRVRLADGVSVVLDSDSLVMLQPSAPSPVLRLGRGRARFSQMVSRNSLAVLVGDARLTGVPGTFDVTLNPAGDFQVTAWRGVLRVEATPTLDAMRPAARYTIRLKAGETAAFNGSTGLYTTATERAELTWPSGVREFRDTPLTEVISAANRYATIKLRIVDPRVAVMRVSGRFSIAEPARLADRLAGVFDLEVDRRTPGVIILSSGRK